MLLQLGLNILFSSLIRYKLKSTHTMRRHPQTQQHPPLPLPLPPPDSNNFEEAPNFWNSNFSSSEAVPYEQFLIAAINQIDLIIAQTSTLSPSSDTSSANDLRFHLSVIFDDSLPLSRVLRYTLLEPQRQVSERFTSLTSKSPHLTSPHLN